MRRDFATTLSVFYQSSEGDNAPEGWCCQVNDSESLLLGPFDSEQDASAAGCAFLVDNLTRRDG
jgi:hypothetical protein